MMRKVVLAFLILAAASPCLGKYSGGSGISADPYQIADANDLLTLAANTGDYGKYFILTADINLDPNLPGGQVFTTAVIARDINNANYVFDGNAFSGVFDGTGNQILNLTIDTNGVGNDYLGLFGLINNLGVVKNLGLENVSVIGGIFSDGIGGISGSNSGSISNCSSAGSIEGGDSYSAALGGLVGSNGGSISKSCSMATVTGGTPSFYLGGLVGSSGGGNIINCYSTGVVTAGANSQSIGGLEGGTVWASIENCFSTGLVIAGTNSQDLGGLVGRVDSGIFINCYFLITGGPNNGYGTPLTDEEMKQQNSFVGWDFNDIWAICETTNYPKLLWQILTGDIVCPDGVEIYDLAELCEQWLFEEIPADLAPSPSGDGIVDFADFSIFANQWGITNNIEELPDFTGQWLKTGVPVCSADISPLPEGDGRVDAADFAVLANDWLEGF